MLLVSCSNCWSLRSWQVTKPKRPTAVSENQVRVSVVVVGSGTLAVAVVPAAVVGVVEVAAVIVHGVFAVAVAASAADVRAAVFQGQPDGTVAAAVSTAFRSVPVSVLDLLLSAGPAAAAALDVVAPVVALAVARVTPGGTAVAVVSAAAAVAPL